MIMGGGGETVLWTEYYPSKDINHRRKLRWKEELSVHYNCNNLSDVGNFDDIEILEPQAREVGSLNSLKIRW